MAAWLEASLPLFLQWIVLLASGSVGVCRMISIVGAGTNSTVLCDDAHTCITSTAF
jgi:hypothetical protein